MICKRILKGRRVQCSQHSDFGQNYKKNLSIHSFYETSVFNKGFCIMTIWFYLLFFYEVYVCGYMNAHACMFAHVSTHTQSFCMVFGDMYLKVLWKPFGSKKSVNETFFLFYMNGSKALELCHKVLTLVFPQPCDTLSASIWIQHKPPLSPQSLTLSASHLFLFFETTLHHRSNHFLILKNFYFRDFLPFPSDLIDPTEILLKDIYLG